MILAGSASAHEVIADATPALVVIQALAGKMRYQVNACSAVSAVLYGRYKVDTPAQLVAVMRQKGVPITAEGTTFNVGCKPGERASEAQQRAAGAGLDLPELQAPAQPAIGGFAGAFAPNVPAGSPLNGYGYAPPQPVAPAIPPEHHSRRLIYLNGKRLAETVGKLAGLEVIAEADRPGPVMLIGQPEILKIAEQYIDDLDVCPTQVRLEMSVLTRNRTDRRNKGFGVQLNLRGGDYSIGGFDPAGDNTITIPGLRAFLTANTEKGYLVEKGSFTAKAIVGEKFAISAGSNVPILSATRVTDRETTTDRVRQNIGNTLEFTVQAVGREIVLGFKHDLSSLGAQTQDGPIFAQRSVSSVLRLKPGVPEMVALSGFDTQGRNEVKRLFGRAKGSQDDSDGAFLVFAARVEPCGMPAASVSERGSARSADAAIAEKVLPSVSTDAKPKRQH